MTEDRTTSALARINAAMERIGRAADARASAPPAAAGDPDLERRHEALRKQTAIAIAEMDALLKDMAG